MRRHIITPRQGRRKVWKSGGANSNVVNIGCPPCWDRDNWSAKIWGAMAPCPTRFRRPYEARSLAGRPKTMWNGYPERPMQVVHGNFHHAAAQLGELISEGKLWYVFWWIRFRKIPIFILFFRVSRCKIGFQIWLIGYVMMSNDKWP